MRRRATKNRVYSAALVKRLKLSCVLQEREERPDAEDFHDTEENTGGR
jgi:hypothetical protein